MIEAEGLAKHARSRGTVRLTWIALSKGLGRRGDGGLRL
jgi:hypothetical protein